MTIRTLPAATLLLILMSPVFVFLQPSAASSNVTATSDLVEQEATLSEIMPKNVRVAVYDEKNTTEPDYVYGGTVSANGTIMAAFLTGRGFDVTLVDASEVTSNILNTAQFDVFVMPDNLPRENTSNCLKDFWVGGGGILSIDSSINFLCWAGMLPAGSAGTHGHNTYWTYEWTTLQTVASLHPTTRSYVVGDDLNSTYLDWASYSWNALSAVADAGQITGILRASTDANLATGVAYDPSNRGGKVVQLPGKGDSIAPDLANVICDSISWLAPVPKARIVFDMSHDPRRAIDPWDTFSSFPGSYVVFRDLLVSMRFTLDKLYPSASGNLTLDRLAPYDILILESPDYNYTAAERIAVSTWVNSGGSLWVFGESPSISSFRIPDDQLNQMMQGMDIQIWMGGGFGSDDDYTGAMHVVNEGVADLDTAATGYLNLTGTAQPLWSRIPDVVCALNQVGEGRLLVTADINWVQSGYLISANILFAKNVADWLSAAGSEVLLFTNEPYLLSYYRGPVSSALNELRLRYELVSTVTMLSYTLSHDNYSFVIVDAPWDEISPAYSTLTDYVSSGGRLLMSYYYAHTAPDDSLWPLLGFLPVSGLDALTPFYIWDPTHPIFNHPVDYGATQFDSTIDYGEMGSKLNVFDNATSLAGFTSLYTVNETLAVERVDGQTLFIGWLIDGFNTDTDESAFKDNFELWLNLVSYMMRPTVDSPADAEYQAGTTGHAIVWHPRSYAPDSYSVTRNGTGVVSGPWPGANVDVSIDGLDVGHHLYVITVVDWAGHVATDEVIVNVTPATTTTTTTTTSTTTTTTTATSTTTTTTTATSTTTTTTTSTTTTGILPGIDSRTLLILVAAVAAVLIIGAVVWRRRGGS